MREFGRNRPAILTKEQCETLGEARLADMPVYILECLQDLYRLPEFGRAQTRLAAPPSEPELDRLMIAMAIDNAGLRFAREADMANWLLPMAESRPAYAFRLRMQRGHHHQHHGRTAEAEKDWKALVTLTQAHPMSFSADEHIELACARAVHAMDTARISDGIRLLKTSSIEKALPYAALAQRALYFGELSQLYRASGAHSNAISTGKKALNLARQGSSSMAGRLANFTVHALIARARKVPRLAPEAIREASKLLRISMERFAPARGSRAYEAHIGFCRHYEAELHRLQGTPYHPVALRLDREDRVWDHPLLFELLSAARNAANDTQLRKECAEALCTKAQRLRRMTGAPLFGVFQGVYLVFVAALNGVGWQEQTMNLGRQFGESRDLEGWMELLQPAITRTMEAQDQPGALAAAEALCDAVPYH